MAVRPPRHPLYPSSGLGSRLGSIARHFGLGAGRAQRQIFERASGLRLPFSPLPSPGEHIWWFDELPLQRLADLPRNALSGPVQEDKATARADLLRIVEVEKTPLERLELRHIEGLCGVPEAGIDTCRRLEDYVATPACRNVRIIGYRDFERTLSQACPNLHAGGRLGVRRAGWRGDRLFGDIEAQAQGCLLAGAIVYARRRQLDIQAPALHTDYRLNRSGIENFARRHVAVAVPPEAWSDPLFMSLLLDNRMPYARLSLMRTPSSADFLLLPRADARAQAFGAGLLAAGAADFAAHLQALAERQDAA